MSRNNEKARDFMSITKRTFGKKGVWGVVTAFLTVGAASAALATPASAADYFTLSGDGDLTHFGTNCAAAGPPAGDAALEWNEDVAAGTVEPQMIGDICLPTPSLGVQAQLIMEYRNNNHDVVATRLSQLKTGTGGLNIFNVNRGGLVFNSASINHTHVRLLSDRGTPGVLHEVDWAGQYL
jgi:hypothetical protein